MLSSHAYLTSTAATAESDFGTDAKSAIDAGGAILFSGNGPLDGTKDAANLYVGLPRSSFSRIEIGRSLRLFEAPWQEALLANANCALTPEGKLVVPYYGQPEANRKGFWSRKWLEATFGATGEEMPDNRLSFARKDDWRPVRSIFSWFVQARQQLQLAAPEIDLLATYSASELGRMFSNVLVPGAPVGPVDRERTFPIESELALIPYGMGGTGYKAPILARILRDHFSMRSGLSLLDLGGDYGQIGAELVLDPRSPVGTAEIVDVSPTKLALAARIKAGLFADRDVFRFRLQPMQDVRVDRSVDVVTFIGSLLYVPRNVQRPLLNRLWESLTPGGLLIVHENIKAPHYTRDYDMMFEEPEIEALLRGFGSIRYFMSSAAVEIPADQVKGKTVFRVIAKDGG